MKNLDDEIHQLLLKYREGKCTHGEVQRLYQIYNLSSKSHDATEPVSDWEKTGNEIWNRLPPATSHQHTGPKSRGIRTLPVRRMAAAVLLLFIVAGGMFYWYKSPAPAVRSVKLKLPEHTDLAPGRNAATLTLSDGRKIILSDNTNKSLSEQNGINILKNKSGQLVYEVKNAATTGKLLFNTLSTGNGQQYQVKLPDGTLVWLNAGSSLTYPAMFSNAKERMVALQGEAYFEVAANKDFNGRKNPFIVQTDKQVVKVLGTHFNISSYENEAGVKTTLLEGAIELTVKGGNHEKVILKPQQRSVLMNNNILVSKIDDAEGDIAWKDGLFHFDNTDIRAVMRELARWYNVDVIYNGKIPDARFTGEMYKNLSASKVLEGLNYTGLHFTISNRRIIVSN